MKKPDIQLLGENFRNKARRFSSFSRSYVYAGMLTSIAAIFFQKFPLFIVKKDDLEWSFLILSFFLQVIAQLFAYSAKRLHLNSRDAYRWFLIWSSIDDAETVNNKPLSDLRQRAVVESLKIANDKQHYPYYSSDKPKGTARLMDNLHESIYHTKLIMKIANSVNSKVIYLTISSFFFLLILLTALHFIDGRNLYLLCFSVLLIIVPILIELLNLFKIRESVSELEILEQRAERLKDMSEDELSIHMSLIIDIFAKYYSLTVDLEVVNNTIYKKYRNELKNIYSKDV